MEGPPKWYRTPAPPRRSDSKFEKWLFKKPPLILGIEKGLKIGVAAVVVTVLLVLFPLVASADGGSE